MDKPRGRDLSRRAALLGLGTLGGCAATPAGVPAAPFSLTVWAWGEQVELLLMNATDYPITLASPFTGASPNGLVMRVRDDEARMLTHNPADDDFVAPYPAASAGSPAYRRLAPWKAIKGTLQTADLIAHMQDKLSRPLEAGHVYDLDFRLEVIGLQPDKTTFTARVRSRSLCVWRFESGSWRTECKSG